jgi:DNA-binding LytR/AlgR family response regulator
MATLDLLLVEDEPPALERLIAGIRAFDPGLRIAGTCASVRETVAYLRMRPMPDLAIFDIQLADGSSFEVLRQVEVACPLIFATAYDDYVLEALGHNTIDYLLKPIRQERLDAALGKYLRLRSHFRGDLGGLLRDLDAPRPRWRRRVLARKGLDVVALALDDVAYFFSEFKITFVRDRQGQQYLVDKTLAELEAELDPALFFRASRKFLVHLAAVQKFRAYDKGRLQVTLQPPVNEAVLISQERAGEFKAWLAG